MKNARSPVWLVFWIAAATAIVGAAPDARGAPATPSTPGKPVAPTKQPAAKPTAKAAAKAAPRMTLSAQEVKPGDPLLVTIEGTDARPSGTAGKTSLDFFAVRGGWQAVFAVPLDDAPAAINVAVGKDLTASVTVKPHEFPVEAAKVEPDYAEPPADKRKIVDADNEAVLAALRNTDPARFSGGFRQPGPGAATSPFGAWRTFNDDPHKSRHLGQDFAARLGAPVRAVQAGKVTLVRDAFLMGGTVVIVHGAGIASAYFHLKDTKLAVGDEVTAGAIIGKVSLTGRTTGPHIHLGLWVTSAFVDPAIFLRLKIRPLRAIPATAAHK